MVVAPVKVLAPERIRVPAPSFRNRPPPVATPVKVSVVPAFWTSIAPVDKSWKPRLVVVVAPVYLNPPTLKTRLVEALLEAPMPLARLPFARQSTTSVLEPVRMVEPV